MTTWIDFFTDPGEVVIDPCAGSGVTLLAAENLGRRGYGFEIKKDYCAAFEQRIRPSVNTQFDLWTHAAPTQPLTLEALA